MTATKKQTKVQRIQAQLSAARASLEAGRKRLQPIIEAEQARVDKLRRAMDQADKAASAAYQHLSGVRHRLENLHGLRAPALASEMKFFAESKGFPRADVGALVSTHVGRLVNADPDYKAAWAAHDVAWKAREQASRAWNAVTSPASSLDRAQHELRKLVEAVEELEHELARTPARNESARDRRQAEREDALRDADTDGAKAVLDQFTFSLVKGPQS